MDKIFMKLSEWASRPGMPNYYVNGYPSFKKSEFLEPKQIPSGGEIKLTATMTDRDTYIYTRVNEELFINDLEIQENICKQFCQQNDYPVDRVFKEIGPGIKTGKLYRKVLWELIELKPKRIVVASLSRLSVFSQDFIKRLLNEIDCELIAVGKDRLIDKKEIKQELVDLMAQEIKEEIVSDVSFQVDQDDYY